MNAKREPVIIENYNKRGATKIPKNVEPTIVEPIN